jgi:hypothetical protein
MKKPQPIHSILSETLKGLNLDFPLKTSLLLRSWREIVGEPIAAQTQPYAIRNRILFVHVSHSVWIQQLQFFKPALLEKINQFLGEPLLQEIRFKLGVIQERPSPRGTQEWEGEKLNRRIKGEIERLLKKIEDEGVKRSLMEVLINSAKLERSRVRQREKL